MIIQRLSKGIKDQDWFVVMVEVMIVVVGIFIGLQVDDWNQERKDRGSETIFLDNLENDLEATAVLLDGVVGRATDSINKANQILDAIPDVEKLTALTDNWSNFVADSMAASAPEIQLATLTQLAEGEQLQYLQDPEMQRIVIALHEYLEARQNWANVTLDHGLKTFMDLSGRVDRRYPIDEGRENGQWISGGQIISGPSEMVADTQIGKFYQRNLHLQALLLDLTLDMKNKIDRSLSEIRGIRRTGEKQP